MRLLQWTHAKFHCEVCEFANLWLLLRLDLVAVLLILVFCCGRSWLWLLKSKFKLLCLVISDLDCHKFCIGRQIEHAQELVSRSDRNDAFEFADKAFADAIVGSESSQVDC